MARDLVQANPYLFLGSRLKRLAEQMQTDVLRVSERAGIPVQVGQYPALAALAETGPMTVTALAKALGFSQPAVTQTVGKLARAGLARLQRDARDGRQRRVALTEAGKRMLDRATHDVWPLVDAAVRETVDGLEGSFVGQLAALEAALADRPLSARAEDVGARRLSSVADADLLETAALINRAYRGIGEAKSWTSEEAYVVGDRTTVADLRAERLATPEGSLLAWRNREAGTVDGCVWLAPLGGDRWYMGALVIEPRLQNAGLGRRLLAASETWMVARGAREVEITVVNVRDALLAWYARRGFALTGETRQWPYEDERYGKPKRDDLHFVVLRKRLLPRTRPSDTDAHRANHGLAG